MKTDRDDSVPIRTARVEHECAGYLIFKAWGRTPPCGGTIEAGERYYDDRRETWEVLRYHVRCGAYGALPTEEPATTRGDKS